MRIGVLPAVAWVAINILAGVGEYVATYVTVYSVGGQGPLSPGRIEIGVALAFTVIAGFLLGGVLWTSLRVRSALFVWPAAQLAVFAVSYAVSGPALQLLGTLPSLARVLVSDALSGALYGAVIGLALVALKRRSRKDAPAAMNVAAPAALD